MSAGSAPLRRLDPGAMLRRLDLAARVPSVGERARQASQAERRAAKPTHPFYGSAEWKALIRQIIAARGRRCQDPHCRTPYRGEGGKVYGDHIVELADGGAPLDESNVLLRCASCHGRKTQEAKRQRAGGRSRPDQGGVYRSTGPSLESGPTPATLFRRPRT